MKALKPWKMVILVVAVAAIGVITYVGYRSVRTYHVAIDWRKQIRSLIENGGTIGEVPAADAFSASYLEAIFGDNPDLLEELKGVISRGIAAEPSLSLGEVAAMIVTYRKNGSIKPEDVVVHVVGGFQLGARAPGFHKDGFFANQIDHNLWNTGNSMLHFLGRDLVLFADEKVYNTQQEMIESIFSGDIIPLANTLQERPLYFTAVFPDPKRSVPPQLRLHVQAFIIKGHISNTEGSWESIILTPSPKDASYALSMIYDMKVAAWASLTTRFGGMFENAIWGPHVASWWAYEMADTVTRTTLEKEQNIVRMKVDFERVMVNATLKSIERMGRDMAQMRGTMDEKLDPRLVDARMRSNKPLNYWSDPHQWGPNWPFAAPTNVVKDASSGTKEAPADTAPPVSQPL